jgi:hypothetical protein
MGQKIRQNYLKNLLEKSRKEYQSRKQKLRDKFHLSG